MDPIHTLHIPQIIGQFFGTANARKEQDIVRYVDVLDPAGIHDEPFMFGFRGTRVKAQITNCTCSQPVGVCSCEVYPCTCSPHRFHTFCSVTADSIDVDILGQLSEMSSTQTAVHRKLFPSTFKRCRGKDPTTNVRCEGEHLVPFSNLSFHGNLFFVVMDQKITVSDFLDFGNLRLFLTAVCIRYRGHYFGDGKIRHKDASTSWLSYNDMVDRGKASKVIGDRPWETPGARGFARLAVYTPSLITNDKTDIVLEGQGSLQD